MSKQTTKNKLDDRALKLVMDLMAIPGKSGEERQVSDYVRQTLVHAGLPESSLKQDAAYRRSPLGGQVGNLVCKLPGTRRGPRRLLVAHLDTVPICVGSRPIRKGEYVAAADRHTGLGADNRAGTAVLLATALALLKQNADYPPVTFLWTVQEETGLSGVRNLSRGLLGKPREAFNFDGGAAAKLTIGATGAARMEIAVTGLASHAGVAPQEGVSAAAIAAKAIATLHENGWHGLVQKNGKLGTSNVGLIAGGEATNVVIDSVRVRAEARSHTPAFRKQIVAQYKQAFQQAAKAVRSDSGMTGTITFEQRVDYESFKLPMSADCVVHAADAVRSQGHEPDYAIANGGLDANWLNAYGIPCVSLGCGQLNIHTVKERLDIQQFLLATRIAAALATQTA